MLDYLELPIYVRQNIYEFLRHQLAYEQHVKKFATTLNFIKNPVYTTNVQKYVYTNTDNVRAPFYLLPVYQYYDYNSVTSYHTEWEIENRYIIYFIRDGPDYLTRKHINITAKLKYHHLDKIVSLWEYARLP